MRWTRFRYIVVLLLLVSSGCLSDQSQDAKKWVVTLDPEDKNPYGTYLVNRSVKFYFPDAEFEPLPKDFRYGKMDRNMKENNSGRSLILFGGLDFKVSEDEWKELREFVSNGNEIIIFCSNLDEKIEKDLSCYKRLGNEADNVFNMGQPDLENKNVLSLVDKPGVKYGYSGRSLKGYFDVRTDTTSSDNGNDHSQSDNGDEKLYLPDTLGYANNRPDFVRYRLGRGHITLHAAPLVLTNYFLLQPGNVDYLTGVIQTLPKNITKIYTHSYYKRSGTASGFSVLWKYPATRWALLLGIFALLLYILFEGKRKQRIIPIIAPLKNESVSFAETVGRLYYNKGDHANLAAKMSQQFLEWVRIQYLLNTNLLNEEFIKQLTIKSGEPETVVRALVDMIQEIKLGTAQIDDAYLYQLYNTIQQFYKNHRI